MKDEWVKKWAGRTVVCVASGPSLTQADCELVRQSGHPVVVTNNTWKMCPWADVLIAFDARWWRLYHMEVLAGFRGHKMCCSIKVNLPEIDNRVWFMPFGNSGAAALSMAITARASRVVMVGYDCKRASDGAAHWHQDHPKELRNASSITTWPAKFRHVGALAKGKGCRVVNASRETALTCFERGNLEELLHT